MAITQKPISVRIDYGVLGELDNFCFAAGARRNMVINRAVRDYVRLLDIFSRCSVQGVDFWEDKDFIEWCRKARNDRRCWWRI